MLSRHYWLVGVVGTIAALARASGPTQSEPPRLPAETCRYTAPSEYDHIAAALLRRMDNTPDSNPLTDAGATLGRVLFYDRQLSRNNKIACASCHLQRLGFSDPRRLSVGYLGGETQRNAMGLANLRYTHFEGRRPGFFWDERAPTLEAQVLMPIQDSVEMGMDLTELEARLQALSYYPPLFQAAFDSPVVTRDRIARAIAQFMRAMTSFDAKFDRAAAAMRSDDYRQDFDSFTPEENLGKSLFIDGVDRIAEIRCAHCHVPPTFGMPASFNNGLDLHYVDQGLGARDVPINDPLTVDNNGKFKAPALRNVAVTAPYMHDGRFQTLDEVLEHYSHGVHPHVNVALAFNEEGAPAESETSGFRFTATQKAALLAFLKTLTDETLLSDPKFADPFAERD